MIRDRQGYAREVAPVTIRGMSLSSLLASRFDAALAHSRSPGAVGSAEQNEVRRVMVAWVVTVYRADRLGRRTILRYSTAV